MKKNGSGFSLVVDERKVALIWFSAGCLFSLILFILNYDNPDQRPSRKYASIVLKLLLPFIIAAIGVIQYRKKNLFNYLSESSIRTFSTECSYTIIRKPIFSFDGNSEVHITYSFRAEDDKIYSRNEKNIFLRRVKKLGYMSELENSSIKVLYDPNNPNINIWEFEMNNLGICKKGDIA